MAMMGALWHYSDLILFKYPAYLRAAHEWPHVQPSRLLEYSLGRTSNVQDTAPWMRRWLSLRAPHHDKLWRTANKLPAAQIALAHAVRGRFWTFPATMVPKFIRWSVRCVMTVGRKRFSVCSVQP